MTKMIWSRLKSWKCPKCNSQMERSLLMHQCTNPKCDFKIGHQRLEQIVSAPPKRYVEPDRSNWDINSNNESDHDERDN